jgi:site-specific recombinase XerD
MFENTIWSPKLLDQQRDKVHLKHYSVATKRLYIHWARRFIFSMTIVIQKDMGLTEVEALLTHLVVDGQVSASTQNQALTALLFLYREVLDQDLP